jgi:hypothetical protein
MRSLRHRHTNANVLIDENYSKRRTCNWGTLCHWQFSCWAFTSKGPTIASPTDVGLIPCMLGVSWCRYVYQGW